MKNTILIADDDANVLSSLQFLLEEEGYQVIPCHNQKQIAIELARHSVDLIISDMNFTLDTTSGTEGLQLVEHLHQQEPQLPIIVMTGWATIDLAVASLKIGANDFIQKPWNDERLLTSIKTQLDRSSAERRANKYQQQNRLLMRENHPENSGSIVAHSPVMKQLLDTLADLAKSNMNILLTGDNGTGKSMLAQHIHDLSQRHDAPFVSVNMGAISENLFESEMFGHVKGAFTDAKESRIGRFEMAESGTLFLDELANIPLSQQAKLLRVLEEHQFEAVGSSKTRQCDVRIISATNADLNSLIEQQLFRQDLYYRLNTIELRVPSLVERQADILPLADYFLDCFSKKYHRAKPALSSDAEAQLLHYHWPGNIRELSHLLERALFLSRHDIIEPDQLHLPAKNFGNRKPLANRELLTNKELLDNQEANNPTNSFNGYNQHLTSEELTLEQIEQQVLKDRLNAHHGNVTETARSLGLSRSGYYRRINKYELE
jgi:DNA-binding NtrC family response regulator